METEDELNQKLDDLLGILKELNKEVMLDDLLNITKVKSVANGSQDLKPLLARLVDDKYLLERPHPHYSNISVYNVSVPGRIFKGYVQQKINSHQETAIVEAIKADQQEQARQLLRMNQRLTRLTWWIAFGTVAAALIALGILVFQWYAYLHPIFPPK